MILSDIRAYLQANKRVTLNDMVVHFNVEADALRGMLAKWIAKGKVTQSSAATGCGTSCCKCDPLLTEIYEWSEEGR